MSEDKPLITNKKASNASIERSLKRKGKTPSQIESYLRGWLRVKYKKEGSKLESSRD